MWHIYTMEYYSAIKRNEMEVFVMRWMEFESVIQSEVSQKEKNKYISYIRVSVDQESDCFAGSSSLHLTWSSESFPSLYGG